MHSGQMGFWQTKHCDVAGVRGCFEQKGDTGAALGVGAGAAGDSDFTRNFPAAGAAVGAEAVWASFCAMTAFAASVPFAPHCGHAIGTGKRPLTGSTSNAYLAPHSH